MQPRVTAVGTCAPSLSARPRKATWQREEWARGAVSMRPGAPLNWHPGTFDHGLAYESSVPPLRGPAAQLSLSLFLLMMLPCVSLCAFLWRCSLSWHYRGRKSQCISESLNATKRLARWPRRITLTLAACVCAFFTNGGHCPLCRFGSMRGREGCVPRVPVALP